MQNEERGKTEVNTMIDVICPLISQKRSALIAVLAGLILMFTYTAAVNAQKPKLIIKPKPTAPASNKCSIANGLTTDEKNEIIAIHTFDRAAYGVGPLKWDCGLAAYAQEWANRSVFGHRDDTPYGESIFVASNRDESIRSAMDRWLAEKVFWTNSTGTCAAGKTCTHFTQMVWRKSLKIGCGINRNSTGKWKMMLVCNYDPAGNLSGPAY